MLTKLSDMRYFIYGYMNGKIGKRIPLYLLPYIQKVRLNRFRRRVLRFSPFYKSLSTGDFKDLPVINKKIHMENFNNINTAGLDRESLLKEAIACEETRDFFQEKNKYSVGLSSGTSGNRGLFVTTREEQCEWAGYIIARVLPFSFKQQKVALFLRANNNLYEKSNGKLIQFKFFDLMQGIEGQTSTLETYGPTILIAPASVLLRLARLKVDIKPSIVISVAEVLDEVDNEIIKNYFQRPTRQIYQCTEGFLASTCTQGRLHLNDDVLLIEKRWLDKSSGRFNPIITDLRRKTQPIVRYHLDDILHLSEEQCSCGRTGTVLSRIEGRMDDVLTMKDEYGNAAEIFPDFVRNSIIANCPTVTDYQVIQVSSDQLEVKLNPLNASVSNNIKAALDGLWKKYGVQAPAYTFSEMATPAYAIKRRRIMSAIEK